MKLRTAAQYLVLFLLAEGAAAEGIMGQKGKFSPLLGKEGPLGEAPSRGDIASLPGGYVFKPESEGVGTLSICIMREPEFDTFSKGLTPPDYYLDAFLTGNEWDALFVKTLRCPDRTSQVREPDESLDEELEKFAAKFKQAIPEYPTLSRISDMFVYVAFQPGEIELLRAECLTVQAAAADPAALRAIGKLLRASEEASRLHSGILLVPD
jgi:hypothetical protein